MGYKDILNNILTEEQKSGFGESESSDIAGMYYAVKGAFSYDANGSLNVNPAPLDKTTDAVASYPQADASSLGACTNYKLISAATTNFTNLKATPGRIYSFTASNSTNVIKYLKFYDKASAPTLSDVPIATYIIQANQTFTKEFPNLGLYFSTGISFGITANGADNDNNAIGASDIYLNINYI